MRRKYLYPCRRAAEAALARTQQDLTLHHIALDVLLRDECAWTERYTARNGAWFQMGLARCSSAHGGIVLVREYYPANTQPSQSARWADTWIREMWQPYPLDDEAQAFWACFGALKQLYQAA